MADAKRTADDIQTLIKRSTQKQWLTAQQVLDMSRKELLEDDGAMQVFIAVLIGGGTFEHWLNAPLEDLEAHLNLADAEDEGDAPAA